MEALIESIPDVFEREWVTVWVVHSSCFMGLVSRERARTQKKEEEGRRVRAGRTAERGENEGRGREDRK